MYQKKISLLLTAALALLLAVSVSFAEGKKECRDQADKFTGEAQKYSAGCQVRGSHHFNDIGCAINFRTELCGLDQVEFDAYSKTYDFNTGNELAMTDAFYVIEAGISTPTGSGVIAFAGREGAIKFVADKGKGKVVDFYELADMGF